MKARVGERITIIDTGSHGARDYRWGTRLPVEAHVVKVGEQAFAWRAVGAVEGAAWYSDEGVTWMRGHGAEVRGALLAARALAGQT